MKHYNLLFKGVEINKRPLDLTDGEFEKTKADLAGSDFELVLHPKSTEIDWFINLSTETAEKICLRHDINPKSVSVNNMVFFYEIYHK
jgi:hypothetical protein